MHVRAERSEQEVAAAAYHPKQGCYSTRHGRTSRPWHTAVVYCWAYSDDLRGFRVSRAGPTVQVQTRRILPKRVAPDAIRGCRRQRETARANAQSRTTKPTCSS